MTKQKKKTAGQKIVGRRLMQAIIPTYFDSQTELLRATGISQSSISDWANGKTDPTREPLAKIAIAIRERHGIPVDAESLYAGRVGEMPAMDTSNDPCPNRAAILSWLGAECSNELLKEIMSLPVSKDRSKLWWIEQIALAQSRLASVASLKAEYESENAPTRDSATMKAVQRLRTKT